MERVGDKYRLTAPLTREIGRPGSGLHYTVPVGETFDVSVPRPLRWLYDQHDPRYLPAAAFHDTMLRAGWSRLVAGAVFADTLREQGVGSFELLSMWLGVSLWKWKWR